MLAMVDMYICTYSKPEIDKWKRKITQCKIRFVFSNTLFQFHSVWFWIPHFLYSYRFFNLPWNWDGSSKSRFFFSQLRKLFNCKTLLTYIPFTMQYASKAFIEWMNPMKLKLPRVMVVKWRKKDHSDLHMYTLRCVKPNGKILYCAICEDNLVNLIREFSSKFHICAHNELNLWQQLIKSLSFSLCVLAVNYEHT